MESGGQRGPPGLQEGRQEAQQHAGQHHHPGKLSLSCHASCHSVTAVNTQARVTTRQRDAKTFLFDITKEFGGLFITEDDYEDNYDYSNEVGDRI